MRYLLPLLWFIICPFWLPASESKSLKSEVFSAITHRHIDELKLLIRSNQVISLRDKHQVTPLIAAAKSGWLEAVELLTSAGADLEAKDIWGWTALMVAASSGHTEVTEFLIQAGSNLNAVENEGFSALIWAAINDDLPIVQLLVKSGADLEIRSAKKLKAIDYALMNLNRQIYEYLDEMGSVLSPETKKQLRNYQQQMEAFNLQNPSIAAATTLTPEPSKKAAPLMPQAAQVLPQVEILKTLPTSSDLLADLGSAREDEVLIIAKSNWDPNFLPVMQSAAQFLMSFQYEEALPLLERARKLSGDRSQLALFWQAKSQFELGRYEPSSSLFQDYLQKVQKPLEKAAALTYLARLAGLMENKSEKDWLELAIERLERAIELSNGRYAPSTVFLARLLESRGEDARAVTSLKKALAHALDPKARNRIEIEIAYFENKSRDPKEKTVANLNLCDTDGKVWNLSDFRGKVVLLHFFSLSRAASQNALPDLKQLASEYSGHDLMILAVSDGEAEASRQLAKSLEITWPVLVWDRTPEVAEYFNTKSIPHTFLIDCEGKLVFQDQGWNQGAKSKIENLTNQKLKLRGNQQAATH